MTFPPETGDNLLGSARGRIIIDSSGVSSGIQSAQNSFASGIQNMTRNIARFGTGINQIAQGLMPLSGAILGIGIAGINTASNFDSAMRQIQARAGLTDEALDTVRETAQQLGADTVFSSQQAADAFLQLLTAGLTTEEALSTLPAVLDAAAAGNMDLGLAADLTTNVMSVFNVEAENVQTVIDAMAQAAASSPASMAEMGEALQRSGGQAQMFGLDVEETSAILAMFAQRGIRGSEAGTQLNSMLRNMSRDVPAVTEAWDELGVNLFDQNGNIRDLDTVFQELGASLENLPTEDQTRLMQTLAGAEGMLGLNALLAGDGIGAMVNTMNEQASASEVAAAQMESFRNQANSLIGSIQSLMITALTPFMNDVLRPMISRMIEIVNQMRSWAEANPELVNQIIQVLAVIAGLAPVLFIIGQVIGSIVSVISGLGIVLGVILSPIGLLIAAVVGLGVAFATNFMGIRDTVQPIIETASTFITDTLVPAFQSGVDAASNFATGLMDAFDEGGFQGAFDFAVNTVSEIVTNISTALQNVDWNEVGQTLLDLWGEAINLYIQGQLWIFENIVFPIFNALNTVIQNTDWQEVGSNIMNAIGTALTTIFNFATWVVDNVLVPMRDNAKTAIENVDWEQVGADTMNAIGAALMAAFDFVTWLIDSIFAPITDNTDTATGQVDWSGVGTSMLNAIGGFLTGVFDFINWLVTNVLGPLISGASSAIAQVDWSTVGTGIMNSIGNSLGNIGQWVQTNIIQPITNSLSNFNPMNAIQGAGDAIGNTFGNIQQGIVSFGSAIGFDTGINVLPEDMLAMVHQGEAIIPADMNPFNPDATQNGLAGNQSITLNGGIHISAQDGTDAADKFMTRLDELIMERDL